MRADDRVSCSAFLHSTSMGTGLTLLLLLICFMGGSLAHYHYLCKCLSTHRFLDGKWQLFMRWLERVVVQSSIQTRLTRLMAMC